MRFPGLNRKRSSTVLLLLGQLVLIAYVFQMGAFDHWHHGASHAEMTPQERAVHAAHCHGDSGGCADTGAGIATLAPDTFARLPTERNSLSLDNVVSFAKPAQAFVPTLSQPPRAV